ncbi:hypothetical protein BO99DRAFT_443643 [Aspergillus violaceofuscus CBS 115571]|uniref:Uncharacterized protein n=1 Tax=Aspergillus violaceofuscus (strain CBS 115571) TaxID=1450538 RepID=A0A2V5H411_ASPV1|nr:hypothetical protein BO99DRAFT_443643 [Aspergillus violaceofuscus CBS 115571]
MMLAFAKIMQPALLLALLCVLAAALPADQGANLERRQVLDVSGHAQGQAVASRRQTSAMAKGQASRKLTVIWFVIKGLGVDVDVDADADADVSVELSASASASIS